MDKILLKILLKFVKLFANKGIDFERLKIITETKVMMDRRRSPASWKRKQQKELKNPLLMTLIMYALMGLFIGVVIFSLKSLLVAMIFIHAYLLFMMAMTLVTDFSAVLLDTADNQILLPKPINSRTLFLSRVVHILVYLSQFFIALTIAPVIFTFINYGLLVGLTTILTLMLTVAFAIFITYLLYAFILRFANEQKIKDIVGYFQIFMTIFFAVGYQVIPRLINFDNGNFTFTLHWYSYLLAPVWMAMSVDSVYQVNIDHIHLLMIACAVIIPIFTVWFMVKFLAPSFSRKLGALGNNAEVIKTNKVIVTNKKDLSEKIARFICISKTESASFEKVWKITSRDKNFKVQFYPGLAYLLVFAFVFIFKSGKNITEVWRHLHETKMFLWFIYLPLISISSSLAIIPFNENFTAAWIYQSVPLTKPGEVISGGIKVLLIKFFIPVYFILFGFAFYIWGQAIIGDFTLGFFNNILIFLLIANISEHSLPFSRQANIKQQTGKIVRALLQLILIGALIGIHFFALKIFWLPSALIPVSATVAYLLLRRIQNLPWLQISI